MARVLGVWLDQVDDNTESLILAIKPGHIIVAENAWGYIPRLRALVPDADIVARDTYTDIGGDAYINQQLQSNPRSIATTLAQRMINRVPDRTNILHDFSEPPVETEQQCSNLAIATYTFHDIVKQAGYKHIGLNLNTGGPGHLEYWDILKDGYNACDYIGIHLYSLKGVDDEWTAFRYSKMPEWARTKPILSTEGGFDAVGIGGWRTQGLDEMDVKYRFIGITTRWLQDKIRGTWYGVGFLNNEQWGSFLPTLNQAEHWGRYNNEIVEEINMPELTLTEKILIANNDTVHGNEIPYGDGVMRTGNLGYAVAFNVDGGWKGRYTLFDYPLV